MKVKTHYRNEPFSLKEKDELENAEIRVREEVKKIMEDAWIIEVEIKSGGFLPDSKANWKDQS